MSENRKVYPRPNVDEASASWAREITKDLQEVTKRIGMFEGNNYSFTRGINANISEAAQRAEGAHEKADNIVENIIPVIREGVDDASVRVDEAQAQADQAAQDALQAAQAAADAQTAASDAQTSADDANEAALEATGIANGKGKVIFQESVPGVEDQSENNLWIRSSDNKPHTWDGTQWVEVTDQVALDAAQAAADADSKADSAREAADNARFLAEGLYQVIPSTTEPTEGIGGVPLKRGDQWWVVGTGDLDGKFVGVKVYDGTEWIDRQIVADSVLVPGSVGSVLIQDGSVTSDKMSASFYYGREFHGGLFEGGEIRLQEGNPSGSELIWDNPGTSLSGVYSGLGSPLGIELDTEVYQTSPTSIKNNSPFRDYRIEPPYQDVFGGVSVIVSVRTEGPDTINISGEGPGGPAGSFNTVGGEWVTISLEMEDPEPFYIYFDNHSTSWIDDIKVYSGALTSNSLRIYRDEFGSPKIKASGSTWTTELGLDGFVISENDLGATNSIHPRGIYMVDGGNTGRLQLNPGAISGGSPSGILKLDASAPLGQPGVLEVGSGVYTTNTIFHGDVSFRGDTGWTAIPSGSGISGTRHWRRYNGIIYVRYDITTSPNLGVGDMITIGTLPAEARPIASLAVAATTGTSNSGSAEITSGGVLRHRNSSNIVYNTARGAIAYPSIV